MALNCNFMRPLARDESAVFLLYLPTVYHFLQRLFALTKQLRPSLYLPVGDYSPLLYRLHIHPASVRLDHPIKLLQATIPPVVRSTRQGFGR